MNKTLILIIVGTFISGFILAQNITAEEVVQKDRPGIRRGVSVFNQPDSSCRARPEEQARQPLELGFHARG